VLICNSLQKKARRIFNKVGGITYRHAPSGNYYALPKRSGKQFPRSLKSNDRALANQPLADLKRNRISLPLTRPIRVCEFIPGNLYGDFKR